MNLRSDRLSNISRASSAGIRAWVLLALVCGSWSIAQETSAQESGTPQDKEIVLVEVPLPDLRRLRPEIRELIEPAIAYFEAGRDELDGAELGFPFGRLGMHFHAYLMLNEARAAYRNALLMDSGNFRWS